MHYKPREKLPKVETERFEFDFRLIDLLEIVAKKRKTSKNKIFEEAIIYYCKTLRLTFDIKRKIKRKYLVKPSTHELLESYCECNNIPKNSLVNRALKFYLMERFTGNMKQVNLFHHRLKKRK